MISCGDCLEEFIKPAELPSEAILVRKKYTRSSKKVAKGLHPKTAPTRQRFHMALYRNIDIHHHSSIHPPATDYFTNLHLERKHLAHIQNKAEDQTLRSRSVPLFVPSNGTAQGANEESGGPVGQRISAVLGGKPSVAQCATWRRLETLIWVKSLSN